MRVFVLCTGRTGSVSLAEACKHMTNFTSGHESKARCLGEERLRFPDQHIEIDNRLTWFLGQLHETYGQEPYYVHLLRDRDKTAHSYNKRWQAYHSIVRAFASSILKLRPRKLSEAERLQVSYDYCDAANSNIRLFLRDKPRQMEIDLDAIEQGFTQLWQEIGAEGNLQEALQALNTPRNTSKRTGLVERMKVVWTR